MRVRTGISRLCHSLAPWLLAAAAAAPWTEARSQSLIDALVSTYNTNPDLLAQRARLRVVDETVGQARAGPRPAIGGRTQADTNDQDRRPTPGRRTLDRGVVR